MRGPFFSTENINRTQLASNATSCFILFVFFVIAIATTSLSDPGLGFSVDQITYSINARAHGEILSEQPLTEFIYRFDFNDTFSLFLYHLNRLTNDLTLSYKLVLLLISFLYLCSMYVFLKAILNNRAIALLVTVLSIVPRYCLGTTYWGMGEFQTIRGRLLVMPIFPLVLLLFNRHISSKKVFLPFLLTVFGLMLHLSMAYLYMILILSYLLYYNVRISKEAVFNLIILCLFLYWAKIVIFEHCSLKNLMVFSLWHFSIEAINFALGFGLLLYYIFGKKEKYAGLLVLFYFSAFFILCTIPPLINETSIIPFDAQLFTRDTWQDINRAIYARFGWTLFPISPATIVFVLFNGSLVFLLGGYEFFRRYHRQKTNQDAIFLWFGISILLVSLGVTGLLQIYPYMSKRPYIMLETFRASKFIYLFFYVYLGFFFLRLWEKTKESKRLSNVFILAGLIVFLLIPPKSMLYWMPDEMKSSIRIFAEERLINKQDFSQATYLKLLLPTRDEIQQARIKQQQFLAMCDWANHNTPEDSMFLTTDYRFIFYANRDIRLSFQQGSKGTAESYSSKMGYLNWYETYTEISTAFQQNDSDELVRLARKYNADYIIIENILPMEFSLAIVYDNPCFKIYRVP